MALQANGQIDFSDVNVELGLSATTQISLGQASVRNLYGIAAGAIRLAADGYGKSSGPIITSYNFNTTNNAESWSATNATISVLGSITGAAFEANTGTDIFNNITEANITGGRRLTFPNANALFRFTRTAYSNREVTIIANLRRQSGTGSLVIDYGDSASPTTISSAELPLSTYTVITKNLIAGAEAWLDFPNNGNYTGWILDIDYIQVNVTGSLTLTSSNNDPFFRSPVISLNGNNYRYIKIRIRRLAGTGWDGSVYYSNGIHGESELYKALMTEPTWDGSYQLITVDMGNLLVGGTDWLTSTITQVRFDFGLGIGDDFEIDYITLGNQA